MRDLTEQQLERFTTKTKRVYMIDDRVDIYRVGEEITFSGQCAALLDHVEIFSVIQRISVFECRAI